MAQLSGPQIGALWIARGGNPKKAAEAAAVALCESDGKTDAPPNDYGAAGLWQFIPSTLNRSCALNPICATDEAIKLSKNGTDWSAWDCHSDSRGRTGRLTVADTRYSEKLSSTQAVGWMDQVEGLLEGFAEGGVEGLLKEALKGGAENLGRAGGAAADAAGNALGIDFSGLTGALEGVGAFFIGLGELLLTPEGWIRIAKVGGGVALLLWGLNVLVVQTTGTNPVKTASKVASVAT